MRTKEQNEITSTLKHRLKDTVIAGLDDTGQEAAINLEGCKGNFVGRVKIDVLIFKVYDHLYTTVWSQTKIPVYNQKALALAQSFNPSALSQISGKKIYDMYSVNQSFVETVREGKKYRHQHNDNHISREEFSQTFRAILHLSEFSVTPYTPRAEHYLLSTAFCYRNDCKTDAPHNMCYGQDFIEDIEERSFVVIGHAEAGHDFLRAIDTHFPEAAGMFKHIDTLYNHAVDEVTASHKKYSLVLVVDATLDVQSNMQCIRHCVWSAHNYDMEIKAIFIDRHDHEKDRSKWRENINNCLAKRKYTNVPVICSSSKTALTAKKDSAVVQKFRDLLTACEAYANGRIRNSCWPQLRGPIIFTHILRIELGAIDLNVWTPLGKAVNAGLMEIFCCIKSVSDTVWLPNEVQDIIQYLYLAEAFKHPFSENGCAYPPPASLFHDITVTRELCGHMLRAYQQAQARMGRESV